MTFDEWLSSGHLQTFLYIRRRHLINFNPGPITERYQGKWEELEALEKWQPSAEEVKTTQKQHTAYRAAEYIRGNK